jgi:hypothetical protein
LTLADVFFLDDETDWDKFLNMHRAKPEIYAEFYSVAETLIERGYVRYSAYGVMHIVRFRVWKPGVDMRPEEDFKISNNMIPFYARLFLRDYPEHGDFFQIKEKKLQGFQEEWIDAL